MMILNLVTAYPVQTTPANERILEAPPRGGHMVPAGVLGGQLHACRCLTRKKAVSGDAGYRTAESVNKSETGGVIV